MRISIHRVHFINSWSPYDLWIQGAFKMDVEVFGWDAAPHDFVPYGIRHVIALGEQL